MKFVEKRDETMVGTGERDHPRVVAAGHELLQQRNYSYSRT